MSSRVNQFFSPAGEKNSILIRPVHRNPCLYVPRVLRRVFHHGVEAVLDLVFFRAAVPGFAVPHVVPRVHRDVLCDQRVVQIFKSPEVLVNAVAPHQHRDRGGAGQQTVATRVRNGNPALGAYAHATVSFAQETSFLNASHRERGTEARKRDTKRKRGSGNF